MRVKLTPLGKQLVFPDGHIEEGFAVAFEDTMVERVALALSKHLIHPGEINTAAARAVIAAMREPTEEMNLSANKITGSILVVPIWQAMIDAALEEK